MQMQSRALFIATALALLSSCAVEIKDARYCVLAPGAPIVCDNFLSSNQAILTDSEWLALQTQWGATFCEAQSSFADLKTEIEELCSKTACDYPTQQAIKMIFAKIESKRLTQ
jgi:hypothetical protein